MELSVWARGTVKPAIAFASPWQLYTFSCDGGGSLYLVWSRAGGPAPRDILSAQRTSDVSIRLDSVASAEVSLGGVAAEPFSPPARPPGWTARYATLGTVTLKWKSGRDDATLDLRALPETCSVVARWLGRCGCTIPDLPTTLDPTCDGGDNAAGARLLGLAAAAPNFASTAADALGTVADAAAASPLSAVLDVVTQSLPSFAGAAVSVLGKVLEVAGEVPCIGGLARVLLMLRDGVAAVQAHSQDASDFQAVLQLYARALADTASALAGSSGGVSATLQGVTDSLREELREEIQAKAADLDAIAAARRGTQQQQLAAKAWAAVVGSLRDSLLRGEDSKLRSVTERLRARLPELCAALQIETLGRVTAATASMAAVGDAQQAMAAEQRATTALLQRLCESGGVAAGEKSGPYRSPLPSPELWASSLLGSRAALRLAANGVAEAHALLSLAAEAARPSHPTVRVLVLCGPASALRAGTAAWATERTLADAEAAAADPAFVGRTAFAWVDLSGSRHDSRDATVAEPLAAAEAQRRPWVLVAAAGGLAAGGLAHLSALLPTPTPEGGEGGGGHGLVVLLCNAMTGVESFGSSSSPSSSTGGSDSTAAAVAAVRAALGGRALCVAAPTASTLAQRSRRADALAQGGILHDLLLPPLPGSVTGAESDSADAAAEAAATAALAAVRAAATALDVLPDEGGVRARLEDVAAILDAADALLGDAAVPGAATFGAAAAAAGGVDADRVAAGPLAIFERWCEGTRAAAASLAAALRPQQQPQAGGGGAGEQGDRFAAAGTAAAALRAALLRSAVHPALGAWRAAIVPALDATLRVQRDIADVRAAQRAEAVQLEARFDRVEAMVAVAAAATADRVMAALAQAGGSSGARGAGGPDPLLRAAAVAEALDARLRLSHVQWGRALPPVFGLRLPDLADVPPAELALWWVEEAAATAAAGAGREAAAGNDAPVMQVAGRAAMDDVLSPRRLPGVRVVVGAAGMGKSWLFNCIAACHAAAALAAAPGGGGAAPASPLPSSTRGDIRGPDLLESFPRVILLRLRRLGTAATVVGSRWGARGAATVGEAAAAAIAELYDMPPAAATPAELAEALFGAAAPRTLWLLDGFDEVPGALELAPRLAAAAAEAYEEEAMRVAAARGAAAAVAPSGEDAAPSSDASAAVASLAGAAADVAAASRVEAVLRALLSRPYAVVSSRPQFGELLGRVSGRPHARFLRLEALRTEAVHAFVRAALRDDAAGLRRVESRMASVPALLDAMRSPALMQMAIAAYRYASDDGEGEGGDRGGGGKAGASGGGEMTRLAPAGGCLSDAELAVLDPRSPITGLYVRIERLLARQFAQETQGPSSSSAWDSAAGRDAQWRRLRALLSRAALEGCATPGAASAPWPFGHAEDLAALARTRIVDVLSAESADGEGEGSGGCDATTGSSGRCCAVVEFPHRSLQEYFAALGAVDALQQHGREQQQQQESGALAAEVGSPSLADLWGDVKEGKGSEAARRSFALTALLSPRVPAVVRTRIARSWPLCEPPFSEDPPPPAQPDEPACPPVFVATAAADPANDRMRLFAAALCPAEDPAAAAGLVAALKAGTSSRGWAPFVDLLGQCVRELGTAPERLPCAPLFAAATAAFWEGQGRSALAQALGHHFWTVADVLSGGGQARRALTSLAAFASPCNVLGSGLERACAGVAVLGCLSRLVTPGDIPAAVEALRVAAASKQEALAVGAALASAILDAGPGSLVSLRQRLLNLALRPGGARGSAQLVQRAAAELAARFPGARDVHAELLRLAMRPAPSPFVQACMAGPGIALVSLEVAAALFRAQWLDAGARTALATRLWHRDADPPQVYVDLGYSPLHVAAARGRADFIALVCSRESTAAVTAAVSALSKDGCTPLFVAAAHAQTACIQALLAVPGVDAAAVDATRRTPLHALCASPDASAAAVFALLESPAAFAALNDRDADGWSPLHRAACQRAADAVRALLATHAVDVNARTLRSPLPWVVNSTPLHLALLPAPALAYGAPSPDAVVLALLDAPGVDATIRDAAHATPLHYAVRYGASRRVVEALLRSRRVDPNDAGHTGATALHMAAAARNLEALAALLGPFGARVDVNARDSEGRTPLAIARAPRGGAPPWAVGVAQLAAKGARA